MTRALVLGVTAVALSAGAAPAQAVYVAPSYGSVGPAYVAPAPVYAAPRQSTRRRLCIWLLRSAARRSFAATLRPVPIRFIGGIAAAVIHFVP